MRLLFILLFSGLAITLLRAQDAPVVPGPYVSARAGVGVASEGGYYVGSGLSGGYQWNPWVGVGAGIGFYAAVDYYVSSFTGAALQYRIRPGRRWAVTTDVGLILSHYQGHDRSFFEYISDPYPYAQTFVTWQSLGGFGLGLGVVLLPTVRYRVCTDLSGTPDDCIETFRQDYHWSASGVLFTLGFTLD